MHIVVDASGKVLMWSELGTPTAGLIRVVGPVGYATMVKNELVRNGVPARAIVVVSRTAGPLPASTDGISEPASVEIHY